MASGVPLGLSLRCVLSFRSSAWRCCVEERDHAEGVARRRKRG